MSGRTARLAAAIVVLIGVGACRDSSPGDGSTTGGSSTTVASSATTTIVVDSTPTTATDASTTTTVPASPTAVSFGTVTLRIPELWDHSDGDRPGVNGAFGPTIHVKKGYAIARLNVVTFSGTIDDLGPRYCAGSGTSPAVKPSAVRLDDRGLAPVGDRLANFARWTATCPGGPEVHRAWVLPTSRLLFWETCADPAVGGIVSSATVADAVATYADVTPLPNDLVPNCDDSDRTDTTTGP